MMLVYFALLGGWILYLWINRNNDKSVFKDSEK